MKNMGGAIRHEVPGATVPPGSKQSAGQTQHGRNKTMRGEGLSGMPTVRTGGGSGRLVGIGSKGSLGTGRVTTLS